MGKTKKKAKTNGHGSNGHSKKPAAADLLADDAKPVVVRGVGVRNRKADVLRAAILAKGWKNQNEAARRLSISPTTISRWLSGKRSPDREHMALLRDELGIDPDVWV